MMEIHFTPKSRTTKYKVKRVLKYLGVLLLAMILGSVADAIIAHWIKDAFFTFKDDWMFLYGAMCYRLIATWNYE